MKNPILFSAAACLAVFSASFVNANEPSIDIESSSKVRFENVSIETQNGIPVLVGKLKRSGYNSKVLPGHVDYVVKDSDGNLIVEGGAQYSPSLSLRRWKFGSSFSIALPKDLPEDAIVQIGFHRNAYKTQAYSPVAAHTENKLL